MLKLFFLGICQLRLDFTTLILNTPPSSGACSDGFTISSPSLGMEFGTICGQYLSGHHGNSKLLYKLNRALNKETFNTVCHSCNLSTVLTDSLLRALVCAVLDPVFE